VTENAPAINHGAKLRARCEPTREQAEPLLESVPASDPPVPVVPPVPVAPPDLDVPPDGGGSGFARARLAAKSDAAKNERVPVFFIGILHSEIRVRPTRYRKAPATKLS
jgi:hypothetical protein